MLLHVLHACLVRVQAGESAFCALPGIGITWLVGRKRWLALANALCWGPLPRGLQVKLMSTSLAALQPCSHLSGLQALEVVGLSCEEGNGAALSALLRQARGLTQLEWNAGHSPYQHGAHPLPECLAEYRGLRRLSLPYNGLGDLPPGCVASLPSELQGRSIV